VSRAPWQFDVPACPVLLALITAAPASKPCQLTAWATIASAACRAQSAAQGVQPWLADMCLLCCAADDAEAVVGAVVPELRRLRRLWRAARLSAVQQHRCGTLRCRVVRKQVLSLAHAAAGWARACLPCSSVSGRLGSRLNCSDASFRPCTVPSSYHPWYASPCLMVTASRRAGLGRGGARARDGTA
jgi:hypothetical protein